MNQFYITRDDAGTHGECDYVCIWEGTRKPLQTMAGCGSVLYLNSPDGGRHRCTIIKVDLFEAMFDIKLKQGDCKLVKFNKAEVIS